MQDIVVFIDAITVVFEEASKGGSPLSLPIASIEVGHGHSLPNLSLRYMQIFSWMLPKTHHCSLKFKYDMVSAIN